MTNKMKRQIAEEARAWIWGAAIIAALTGWAIYNAAPDKKPIENMMENVR